MSTVRYLVNDVDAAIAFYQAFDWRKGPPSFDCLTHQNGIFTLMLHYDPGDLTRRPA